MGFESPNHTQVPNDLFDKLLCQMGDAELRITLTAIRKTLGFHQDSDEISITQFQNATGLSRQGVIDGLADAVARGTMQEVGTGKRGVKRYALVFSVDQSKPVDQSNELTSTSQDSRPVRAVTSQASRHTKEKNTNKKKETIAPSGADDNSHTDLIKAWLDTSKVIDPAAYAKKTHHQLARAMHTAGVTPDDIRLFIEHRRLDKFWQDKAIKLHDVAASILTWKAAHFAPKAKRYDDTYTPPPPDQQISDEQKAEVGRMMDALYAKFGVRS